MRKAGLLIPNYTTLLSCCYMMIDFIFIKQAASFITIAFLYLQHEITHFISKGQHGEHTLGQYERFPSSFVGTIGEDITGRIFPTSLS